MQEIFGIPIETITAVLVAALRGVTALPGLDRVETPILFKLGIRNIPRRKSADSPDHCGADALHPDHFGLAGHRIDDELFVDLGCVQESGAGRRLSFPVLRSTHQRLRPRKLDESAWRWSIRRWRTTMSMEALPDARFPRSKPDEESGRARYHRDRHRPARLEAMAE